MHSNLKNPQKPANLVNPSRPFWGERLFASTVNGQLRIDIKHVSLLVI